MRARKVDTYYGSTMTEYVNNEPVTINLLTKLFKNATIDTTRDETIYDDEHPDRDINGLPLFQNIWLPVRKVKKVGNDYLMEETSTYYNVGLLPDEIADIYWAHYSGNYLIGKQEDISQDLVLLIKKVKAVFKENLGKYLKLIELEGLIWNPLWNVDGTELRQLLETHGNETYLSTGSSHTVDGNHRQRTHQTAPYDSETFKDEWQETDQGQGGSGTASASSGIVGGVEIEAESGTVSNITGETGTASTDLRSVQHDSISYGVSAGDAAFGSAVEDGDILHTEKYIRKGNIGVTKTTELIEDARKSVSYIILNEFFKDINKVILVGVYGC